jgi:hypothetical protein
MSSKLRRQRQIAAKNYSARAKRMDSPPSSSFEDHVMSGDLEQALHIRQHTRSAAAEDHLKNDPLDILEYMVERTEMMEQHLDDLNAAHEDLLASLKLMGDTSTIHSLFEPALRTALHLDQKVQEMKEKLQQAALGSYAVDAPDGEPDGRIQEEMTEIRQVIEEAATGEDAASIRAQQAMRSEILKDRARDPEHDW